MSYTQAKQIFEAVTKKMQDDLQAYAATEKANQRAVDIRMDILNKLVAFYRTAEEQISELEMQLMGMQLGYSNLHEGLQKLVYWCTLHHINPKPAQNFSIQELEQLLIKNRHFGRPDDSELPEETLEEIKAGSPALTDFLNDQNLYFEKYRGCF